MPDLNHPPQGYDRGITVNYHARPGGRATLRNCVITESAFWVPAYQRWYVKLDIVREIVPVDLLSITAKQQTLSLIPDLIETGMKPRAVRQIPGARPARNRYETGL